ncbi:ABC transporter permease [Plantactinospora alkalitolerans]|uniref:ABC transporter permease n=1 Tax=Plantactinospora alkalitolerans TaxID=2789879 RepID=UPI002B21D9B8|nr:FtsX-like permease family protein [Plantactinospora alkalitolerans]
MRRRRPQTVVIGLVVLCSSTTVLLALTLLGSASAPFDRAFAAQRGAHAVAVFDPTRTSGAALAQTGQRPGVEAAAGPFDQAVVEISEDWNGQPAGARTVVGRADPAGPVDRLDLRLGRWVTAPGEIVVNLGHQGTPRPELLGSTVEVDGAPPLRLVGFASSMTKSADAWVVPEQMPALRPTAVQMLYRFRASDTEAQVDAGLAEATAGLAEGSLTNVQSYLALKQAFSAQADSYLPLMMVFGVLGLVVSVLIIGNVVSGAVVSGYRHIGVLKAIGFTPNQVVAVYLAMVAVPGTVGCLLGTLLGSLLASPVLQMAFSGVETGSAAIGPRPWAPVACLLGMPAVVVVTALIPALRAHWLPAAQAISAGSAPRAGRGLRVQRRLSNTRLPRPVVLGLAQPFTRPGRAVMTVAAIVLGVTAVTLTTGLTSTMVAFGAAGRVDGAARIQVEVGSTANRRTAPKLTDSQIDELLRGLPGADRVTARALLQVRLVGYPQARFVNFYRGDTSAAAAQMVAGHLPEGPGEVVAGPSFLRQHGLAVGDRITLDVHGRQVPATIVGETVSGNPRAVDSNWSTLQLLGPDTQAVDYTVTLAPGADAKAYLDAVRTADPGLHPALLGSGNTVTTTVVGFASVFTVLLTIVAALGVFNTVLLTVRERRRDLGMLKSIGMTPRQVVVMTVTSVAALGVVGGLSGIPLGIVAHRLIVDNVAVVAFPESMKDVWHPPQLALLALAGVVIAVLGALVPARSAARLPIARVLHHE